MRGGPAKSWKARAKGRDGFLMVEALTALALSALLIAALLSFTGLLRRSADRAAFKVEVMETTNRTVLTIANEIRRASRQRWAPEQRPAAGATPTPRGQPTNRNGEPDRTGGRASGGDDEAAQNRERPDPEGQQQQEKEPDRNFVFSGTPQQVTFALAPEQLDGLRAPVMVIYQVDSQGAVLRAEGAIRAGAKGRADVRLSPVAKVQPGPERLKFAYVDKDPTGNETVTDEWLDPRRMPAAVRIDRMDAATGAPISSLRVPILLSGEPGCVNPELAFCSRADRTPATDATQPGRPNDGDTPRLNGVER